MTAKPDQFSNIKTPDNLAEFMEEEWEKNFGKVSKEEVENALMFLNRAEYKKAKQ